MSNHLSNVQSLHSQPFVGQITLNFLLLCIIRHRHARLTRVTSLNQNYRRQYKITDVSTKLQTSVQNYRRQYKLQTSIQNF